MGNPLRGLEIINIPFVREIFGSGASDFENRQLRIAVLTRAGQAQKSRCIWRKNPRTKENVHFSNPLKMLGLGKEISFLFLLIIPLLLSSCRTASDSEIRVDRSHIRTLTDSPEERLSAPKVRRKKRPPPAVPSLFQKLVSVSITEDIPLKEAFRELAHQAGVGLQLESRVTTRIFFTAIQRPLIEVVQDICELAGLRYKINGSSFRVEIDAPYPVNYNLQFLNLARNSENRISIGTDVFSNVKDGKASADNGSNSAITGKTTTDFWTELDGNLKTILTAEAQSKGGEAKSANYSIHRQGGLVTVYGTARQHRLVESYLKSLHRVVSSQVLIEAKVIEVNLKDQYKSGINWQKLAGSNFRVDMPLGNLSQRGRFMDPASAQMDVLSIGLQGKTFTGLLKAIEEFGASRTLSSPRLTVMNNQTAILKVAQNQVYFRLNYDKQLSLMVNRESVSVSSDIQTVPIGLVMSVQPSIDEDAGSIVLSLRPTISRLSQSVRDPAVDIAFNANGGGNSSFQPTPSLIPVVEVREIDSVLRLQSGEIAVLGGLMEARTINGAAKLPIAGDIPVLGELFKSAAEGDEVVELVILLRATIIEEGESPQPDAADQRLYQNYVSDPRPLEGQEGKT